MGEKIKFGREGEADLLFEGGLLYEPQLGVFVGEAIEITDWGSVGVPALPGSFA